MSRSTFGDQLVHLTLTSGFSHLVDTINRIVEVVHRAAETGVWETEVAFEGAWYEDEGNQKSIGVHLADQDMYVVDVTREQNGSPDHSSVVFHVSWGEELEWRKGRRDRSERKDKRKARNAEAKKHRVRDPNDPFYQDYVEFKRKVEEHKSTPEYQEWRKARDEFKVNNLKKMSSPLYNEFVNEKQQERLKKKAEEHRQAYQVFAAGRAKHRELAHAPAPVPLPAFPEVPALEYLRVAPAALPVKVERVNVAEQGRFITDLAPKASRIVEVSAKSRKSQIVERNAVLDQDFEARAKENEALFAALPATATMGYIKNPGNGPHKVDLSEGERLVCRCGQSEFYPFCDQTCKKINAQRGMAFVPWRATAEQVGQDVVYVCGCGQSAKFRSGDMLCDDTCKALPVNVALNQMKVDQVQERAVVAPAITVATVSAAAAVAEEKRLAEEKAAAEEAARKAAEQKAAEQKAADEKLAAERAAADKRAADERAAAEALAAERAVAEKKAADERVAAEKKAAEERAAAEKKAAEERAAAEKKAAEERAAAEKAAAEKAAAERAAAEKKANDERIASEKKAAEERAAAEKKAADERAAAEKRAAEEKAAKDKEIAAAAAVAAAAATGAGVGAAVAVAAAADKGPRPLPVVFFENARKWEGKSAYFVNQKEQWVPLTWAQYSASVRTAAKSLIALGVNKGDRVVIFADTVPEWAVVYLAIQSAGASAVIIPPLCSAEQVAEIVQQSNPSVFVLDETLQWEKVAGHAAGFKSVKHFVSLSASTKQASALSWATFLAKSAEVGDNALEARLSALRSTDVATICYSDNRLHAAAEKMRGAQLSFANESFSATVLRDLLHTTDSDRILVFMPYAETTNRAIGILQAILSGSVVYYGEELEKLHANLTAVQPTVIFSAPILWERFEAVIKAKLGAADADALPPAIKEKLRKFIGCHELRVALSGTAAIHQSTVKFYRSLGVTLRPVFGSAALSGICALDMSLAPILGSTGKAVPGVRVRTAGDMLEVQGPNVFLGYLGEFAVPADSWFPTGDAGSVSAQSDLKVFGSLSNAFFLTNGAKIYPEQIELELRSCPLIAGAIVFGENKPFVGAIVSVEREALTALSKKLNMSIDELAASTHTLSEIDAKVQQVNATLPETQRIKKYKVIPREFSVKESETTSTMVLLRRVLLTKFQSLINEIFHA